MDVLRSALTRPESTFTTLVPVGTPLFPVTDGAVHNQYSASKTDVTRSTLPPQSTFTTLVPVRTPLFQAAAADGGSTGSKGSHLPRSNFVCILLLLPLTLMKHLAHQQLELAC